MPKKIKLRRPICPQCKSDLLKKDDRWTDAMTNVVVNQYTCLNCHHEFVARWITSSNGFKYYEQDNPYASVVIPINGEMTQTMNRVREIPEQPMEINNSVIVDNTIEIIHHLRGLLTSFKDNRKTPLYSYEEIEKKFNGKITEILEGELNDKKISGEKIIPKTNESSL